MEGGRFASILLSDEVASKEERRERRRVKFKSSAKLRACTLALSLQNCSLSLVVAIRYVRELGFICLGAKCSLRAKCVPTSPPSKKTESVPFTNLKWSSSNLLPRTRGHPPPLP